ncbi:MAG: DUF1849 family protein [Rhodospirillales bacterium]|nr:DUF1849 family protein [Rhodospirillales bacterium]
MTTAILVVALMALIGVEAVFAADMVAHRAFYSMKLGTVRAGSDFVGVRGNMGLSMERTCEGWTMSQTLRMDLATATGDEVKQDLRFTAWESDDGTQYRFFASNNVNGEREDFRGRAQMSAPEGNGNANYQIPKGIKIPLPQETMFPLGHTAWMIERAMAGDRQVSRIVFDGADGEGPQLVSAFIGPKLKSGDHISKAQAAALGPLSARPGWNIRMGFYELDTQQSAPDYEVEILQLENGVTPLLTLDYQDFTVILTQERLEEIPLPDCQ